MLPTLLRVAVTLIVLFVVLSAAMLAIGSTQPMNPSLNGFVEGCENAESLCWYGIVSGEIKLYEAREIFNSLGYEQINHEFLESAILYRDIFASQSSIACNTVEIVYQPDLENPTIALGRLQPCSNFYVQDVLDIFGNPKWIQFTEYGGILHYNRDILAIFRGDFQLYAPVTYVWINYFGYGVGGPTFDWQGVFPLWHYCEFQSNYCYWLD